MKKAFSFRYSLDNKDGTFTVLYVLADTLIEAKEFLLSHSISDLEVERVKMLRTKEEMGNFFQGQF